MPSVSRRILIVVVAWAPLAALLVGLGFCCPAAAADNRASDSNPEFLPSVQQWVLSDHGRVRGRLISPAGDASPQVEMRVRLIENGGENTLRAVSDARGVFEFENVPSGTFTFVASGKGQFASYPVHVRPKEQPAGTARSATVQREISAKGNSVDAFSVPVASVSAATVKEFARRYVPAKLAGTVEPTPLYSAETELPSRDLAAVQGTFPSVCLNDDDSVGGILLLPAVGGAKRQPAMQMNVRILSEQQVMAETTTNAAGEFEISDLPSGNYALVAAGKDGFVVLGFQVVDAIQSGVTNPSIQRLCAEVVPICEVVRATEISAIHRSTLRLFVRGD